MPKEAFEVIVGQSGNKSEQVAIASAAQYLAYADQTDTFGYSGDVFDVNVYDGPTSGADTESSGEPETASEFDYGIGLCFAATIENDDALKRFMDEMTQLAHVESVGRVYFEVME
jgi:hypothetical protein